MNRFEGKIVLITGASSGMGLASAKRFADEGARVFCAQRTIAHGFTNIEADFSDLAVPEGVISEVIEKAGRLDVLVNNAGIMKEGSVEEMPLDEWQQTLNVNLTAPYLLTKYAMPHLCKTKGSIVNIGSIEGLGSNPRHPAYCASKAGLHALTRAVAVDHGPEVRCNAVAPGWIDTPLNVDFINAQPDPETFNKQLGAIHPIGRTGAPEEVASLVTFLASEEAGFITGQIYTVDGGRTAKLSLP